MTDLDKQAERVRVQMPGACAQYNPDCGCICVQPGGHEPGNNPCHAHGNLLPCSGMSTIEDLRERAVTSLDRAIRVISESVTPENRLLILQAAVDDQAGYTAAKITFGS